MPSTDRSLPENAKPNLDRRLDEGIEETFPTSDPVSVAVTRMPPGDIAGDSDALDWRAAGQETLRHANEALGSASVAAAGLAREAYAQGRGYADTLRQRYPDPRDQAYEAMDGVRRQAGGHPVVTLLVGAVVGFALAQILFASREHDRGHRRHG